MKTENIVIVGISTAANNICRFIEKYRAFNILGFAVDSQYKMQDTFLDRPVYELECLHTVVDKTSTFLFVAMQWNHLNGDRRRLYERLKADGWKFANLISPTAVINGSLNGDNCWISDLVCIDTDAQVGNNVFVKVGAWVGDHAAISDHCFIGAKSTIGGGVKIGEQSFIGLGATVFDDTTIGRKCIVGATTAVKRNLPDFSVYKTSQEMFVTKQYPEDVMENKLQFKKNVR